MKEDFEEEYFDELFWELFWEYVADDEEVETCPEGYSEDEWCEPHLRRGCEFCEFLCPFGRMKEEKP